MANLACRSVWVAVVLSVPVMVLAQESSEATNVNWISVFEVHANALSGLAVQEEHKKSLRPFLGLSAIPRLVSVALAARLCRVVVVGPRRLSWRSIQRR
jgi:hypothetical protein